MSYPRNLVPGGPSCKILLTKLSPSLRGGGAVGKCNFLLNRGGEQVRHTVLCVFTGFSVDFKWVFSTLSVRMFVCLSPKKW